MWWACFCSPHRADRQTALKSIVAGQRLWFLGPPVPRNLGTGVKKWVGLWFPGKSWVPQGCGLVWLAGGRKELLDSCKEMWQGTALSKSYRGEHELARLLDIWNRQHLWSCSNCRKGFHHKDLSAKVLSVGMWQGGWMCYRICRAVQAAVCPPKHLLWPFVSQ